MSFSGQFMNKGRGHRSFQLSVFGFQYPELATFDEES